MDKINLFGGILLIILSCVELYCLHRLRVELRRKSQEKSEARREALRPPAYKKVRGSWAIYRNRRSLWASIKK